MQAWFNIQNSMLKKVKQCNSYLLTKKENPHEHLKKKKKPKTAKASEKIQHLFMIKTEKTR